MISALATLPTTENYVYKCTSGQFILGISALGFMDVKYVYTVKTPMFTLFLKWVVNIVALKLKPVSNESPGNSKYYRGTLKILNPSIFFEK